MPRKKIIELLTEKGHAGITPVNITKWSKSGYKLWLQERERFQCLRLKIDETDQYFRHLDANGQNRANYVNGRLIDGAARERLLNDAAGASGPVDRRVAPGQVRRRRPE